MSAAKGQDITAIGKGRPKWDKFSHIHPQDQAHWDVEHFKFCGGIEISDDFHIIDWETCPVAKSLCRASL